MPNTNNQPKVNSTKLSELNLTKLEEGFLAVFINLLYAEEGFSDVDISDIAEEMNVPTNKLRGVLSSLIKKEIVCVGEDTFAGIIYLNEAYYYLHNEWGATEPAPSVEEKTNELLKQAKQKMVEVFALLEKCSAKEGGEIYQHFLGTGNTYCHNVLETISLYSKIYNGMYWYLSPVNGSTVEFVTLQNAIKSAKKECTKEIHIFNESGDVVQIVKATEYMPQ